MEDRDDTIKFRVEASLKRQFDETCRGQDQTASQVLRSLIRDYIRKHSQPELPEMGKPARRRN